MNLHGIKPNRRAGQNFLQSRPVAEKFVACAAQLDAATTVIEIGPGLGSITYPLCDRFANVVAIEKDSRIYRLWGSELSKPANLTILHADAAVFDYSQLAKQLKMPRLAIFGNLPFSVSTIILERLFIHWTRIAYAQLTFQKEVAARLLALPGQRSYGSLTVFCRTYCDIERQMRLSRGQFYPQPKVDADVVGLTFLATPRVAIADLGGFEHWVRQIFLLRRKTLINAIRLSPKFVACAPAALEYLKKQGVDLRIRAEMLDLDQLYALYKHSVPGS